MRNQDIGSRPARCSLWFWAWLIGVRRRNLSDAHDHDPDAVRRGLASPTPPRAWSRRRCRRRSASPFVVENRPGAGGMLSASAVARATNDGYTLLLTTNSTHSAANGLFKNVPYDPIKDFTPDRADRQLSVVSSG